MNIAEHRQGLLWSLVDPYLQGFADSRQSGTRYGPVHLFEGDRWHDERSAVPLCGRTVKFWNFEGETEEDFCPRCVEKARARANKL